MAEMRKVFDHDVSGQEAAKRLLRLRQGASSVAEFSIQFRTLAAESGWNREALVSTFSHALSEKVKDELASREPPASLEDLISLAIRIDNRICERNREKKQAYTRPMSEEANIPHERLNLPLEPLNNDDPEPIQIGRTRLTSAERQKRMSSGACLYCGRVGHFIRQCPSMQKRDTWGNE